MEDKEVVPAAKPEAASEAPRKGDIKGWISLDRERSVGSVTGSEFRIWGEK